MNNSGNICVRVVGKHREAYQIVSFELINVHGSTLPMFSAGAHIDVHLPNGITRQYSLCNNPADVNRYVIAVLREQKSRGGSEFLHDAVQVGDLLEISPPRNHFLLTNDAKHSLLVAGGIGITPLLCMANTLDARNSTFEMYYCARSRAQAAFFNQINESAYSQRVKFYFDDESYQRFDIDTILSRQSDDTHLYICGPKGFMESFLGVARSRGWPDTQIHFESFSNSLANSNDGQEFQIKLASTQQVMTVAADQTVVDVLAMAGVSVPTSCNQGVCGTCLTRVLDGEPDHRDSFLTSAERVANDQFTPCCSRSKSPMLVLDL